MTPDAAERRARALLDGHSLARDAAPDLARDVLALADALRTERAAREAAEAQHAALAGAVRASCAAIAENFGRVKAADWATAHAIAEAIRKGDDQ